MRLHLLAVPKDYPKSTSTSFCGRTYPGNGPRQPEDKSPITTACGEATYFRSVLSYPIDTSICKVCFQKISLLPEDQRSRVLVVTKKHLDDKLEDWETELATPEEIEKRINLQAFRLRIFDWQSIAPFTGLNRDLINSHLVKMTIDGFFTYDEAEGWYSLTEDREKILKFANMIMRYHKEDNRFQDLDAD